MNPTQGDLADSVAPVEISVVVPNYNGSRTISATLRSVLEQAPPGTEVVVADDCSTDDSVDKVRSEFPSVSIHRSTINRGAAATRNAGISLAQGRAILLLDSDVVLGPSCLSSLLHALESADIAFPLIVYESGDVMYPVDAVQAAYPLISPVFMIRRASLRALGEEAFDETYQIYCEDTDFFLRSYLAGLKAAFVGDARATHNVSLKPRNREHRYFLEVRNSVYGAVKFMGIRGISHFDHAFKPRNVLRVIVSGLFNFNLFDLQAHGYRKHGGARYELGLLFGRHDRLTERGRWRLLVLTARALLWNVTNLPASMRARRSVRRWQNGQSREASPRICPGD